MKASSVSITAVVALALALSGCDGEPAPEPVIPTQTGDPAPSVTPEPSPSVDAISDELKLRIEESITSDNTAALEQDMADTVLVTLAGSEATGPRTPVEAINDLDYISVAENWTFPLSDTDLATYENSPYTQFVIGTPYGGVTDDRYFVIFGVEGGKIASVFYGVDFDIQFS